MFGFGKWSDVSLVINEGITKLTSQIIQWKISVLGKHRLTESEKNMNTNTFKSIGAVFAGIITDFVLSVGTDTLLEKLNVFPPQNEPSSYIPWMLLLALIYRSIYAVVGCYVAATLAPSRPMRHAIVLGIIGIVLATLGSIANWDKTSASTAWYPFLLIILTLPCAWLGGKMRLSFYANNP